MNSTLVRVLLIATALLAIAGIGIAAYLTVVHFADQPIVCSGIGDCEKVNSSRYAKLAGVPVAVLGLLSYVTMLALVLVALSACVWTVRDDVMGAPAALEVGG